MTGLSKSRLLYHRQCPKRLWLHANRPELANETNESAARLAVGSKVGEVARGLYPQGVLIDTDNLTQALAATVRALAGQRRPIFEAALRAGRLLIRADLLLPAQRGYRLVEVKSCAGVKDHHLEDVSIQAWAARAAGLSISRVDIAHIDNSFVYPGSENYDGLFAHVDVSTEVRVLEKYVPKWMRAAQRTLGGSEPSIEPGDHCHEPFACPYHSYRAPEPDSLPERYPPEILPYGRKVAAQLRDEGFDDLRKVPKSRLTNPKHLRIWRATKNQKAELNSKAGEQLRAFGYPRYYLDFETINFAVPVWAGTRPYAQVPFQWSCHVEQRTGKVAHLSFLSDGAGEPRRACAESLVQVLKARGPIFVYNAAFERGQLRQLAAALPDLAKPLNAVIERLVDLLPIARDYYYHPAMRGSWSLKKVLPTIAPELAYDDLEVADGGMAQAAFAEMLHPETSPERRAALREALLKYCERDTWAMVRIARYFEGRAAHA